MEASTVVETTQVRPLARTYFSHNKTYIIPRVKPEEVTLPTGKTIVRNKSDYEKYMVEFRGGFFYAKPGDLIAPNPDTGEPEDVVTFLEGHPNFGLEFFLQEQAAPDPTEVLSQMARLLAAQDVEGLAELYKQEQANWARPQVLEPIQAAVEQFESGA